MVHQFRDFVRVVRRTDEAGQEIPSRFCLVSASSTGCGQMQMLSRRAIFGFASCRAANATAQCIDDVPDNLRIRLADGSDSPDQSGLQFRRNGAEEFNGAWTGEMAENKRDRRWGLLDERWEERV